MFAKLAFSPSYGFENDVGAWANCSSACQPAIETANLEKPQDNMWRFSNIPSPKTNPFAALSRTFRRQHILKMCIKPYPNIIYKSCI